MTRRGSLKSSMPIPAAAVQWLWGALTLLLILTFRAGVHAIDGNPEGTASVLTQHCAYFVALLGQIRIGPCETGGTSLRQNWVIIRRYNSVILAPSELQFGLNRSISKTLSYSTLLLSYLKDAFEETERSWSSRLSM